MTIRHREFAFPAFGLVAGDRELLAGLRAELPADLQAQGGAQAEAWSGPTADSLKESQLAAGRGAFISHRTSPTTRIKTANLISTETRQKVGRNRSRASERRTCVVRARHEAAANGHNLPSPAARPRGFEPLTFGSVGGDSTCPASLFPCGIACTDAILELTRAATRGHAMTRSVPTSFPAMRLECGTSAVICAARRRPPATVDGALRS
jgi:hypothetical protein